MNNADISVVIPVKNAGKYIDSLLKLIFSQKVSGDFEVIIVDSGSKDNTLDIIKDYPVRLYQLREKEFNHGLTRNFGISKAQGKYVVLMTQDALPFDVYWMEGLISGLKSKEDAAGVYSRQVPRQNSHPLVRIRVNRFFTSGKLKRESQILNMRDYIRLSPADKYRLCNFDNVSSCIRKSVWERIPFPGVNFAEDLEWSKKVLEAGYRIIYEPGSIVYHSHDFSIAQGFKRNRVNHNKLCVLFGFSSINSIYKLLIFSVIYTVKDFYYLCRGEKSLKNIFSSFYLVPFFSISSALGQYKGFRDYQHNKSFDENSSDCT